jgi:hypothetical protein
MAKSPIAAEEKRLRDSEEDAQDGMLAESPTWKPGYVRRFPIYGALALLVVIFCAAASVAILWASDHVSSSRWPTWLAPNVCIQLVNAVSGIMLAIAVTEGIAIAWWRKAMQGASLTELHRSWEFSSGFQNVVLNFTSFDKIALAALALKISVIDGILFQRATSSYVAQDPPVKIETMAIATTEFPSTGFVLANNSFGGQASCGCFMIGDAFTPVVNAWESSNGFFKDFNDWFRSNNNEEENSFDTEGMADAMRSAVRQHCQGMCYSEMEAIGFEIDCDQQSSFRDVAAAPIQAYEEHGNGTIGDSSEWTTTIFNTSFTLHYPDSALNLNTTAIVMDLTYFQAENPFNPSNFNCEGTIYQKSCVLRPALVTYPVRIMNYSNPHVINGVSLQAFDPEQADTMMESTTAKYDPELKQAEGFKVGEYINITDTRDIGDLTTLGGIATALDQFLSAFAQITYNGEYNSASVWALKQQGPLAQTMMVSFPGHV